MFLKSVRVENFKCIEDSNEFSVEPVTCLVGKNESGKTALLQAIYKLNPAVREEGEFNYLEYPRVKWTDYKKRRVSSPDDVLTTVWELDEADRQALREKFGPETVRTATVTITKGYDNKQYWDLNINEKQVVAHFLRSAALYHEEMSALERAETIAELLSALKSTGSPSVPQSALLNALERTFPNGDPMVAAINILKGRLPTFVYFADYQKMPGQVAIDELLRKQREQRLQFGERVFLALLDLADMKPEEIQNIARFEELVAELEAVSNRLSEEIFEYWSQNRHLEVDFRFDAARPGDPPPLNTGYIFRTRIRNKRHGVTVSFDERSAGFVWFFSFLIWFSQVRRYYGENLFILLDEPGLGLHARAQADLLRYINEKLKPNYQVIYTTHSPFMIDPENIAGVRTVEDLVVDDRVQGTKVGGRGVSTDADTIFPAQAALGYDITRSLFVDKPTLLVGDPSDLLYLKWFSHELQSRRRECVDPRWVVSPVGGVEKIASYLALFGSTKEPIAVLTDFHGEEKQRVLNLKESDLLRKGHVFSAEMYADQDEAGIEDLLGRSCYIRLVNDAYALEGPHRILEQKPSDAPIRVVKEVENHFATLPPTFPTFDPYTPASYLAENSGALRNALPDLDEALGRFERLFKDLNKLFTA
ncbi:MAG: AAA family ATPase [Candidatus Rokubacteria bacterium]|nr:AAA family ATPase [Candidatus Rokubacteria bacterium]